MLIVAYPLAQSYERRIRFLSQWKAIFTAMAIAGSVFLAWDELFTTIGVWGFNERYLTGIYYGHLPLEECLFFVAVPFSTLFIYEVIGCFFPDAGVPHPRAFLLFFLIFTLVVGWYFFPRLYTSVTFFFAATLLAVQLFFVRSPWLGRFFITYFVSLVPFLVMNGWLTGAFTDEPIVWYNDIENMGLRLITIPFEDTIYLLGYLLLLVWMYERSRSKEGVSA